MVDKRLHVCMLVTNDMFSDPRVSKHAVTLGHHGFKVTVVCPLSDRTRRAEVRDGYEILRVRSELLHYGKNLAKRRKKSSTTSLGQGVVATIPHTSLKRTLISQASVILLQLAILRAARKIDANIICANDFDTLLIGVLATGFDRILIYDSHELYTDMLLVPPYHKRILQFFEKLLINRAHFIMTVNELIADVLTKRYSIRRPVYVVYNCPAQTSVHSPKTRHTNKLKTVLYQGRYTYERGLENLVRASQYLLPDIQLVFRGYGDIEKELRSLASGRPNIRFEDPVAMEDVVEAARSEDVGIVSYLPRDLNNYLASPNKLFEYIQAGLPIAASNVPFMRKIILENDIGALFDPRDPQDIARALNKVTRTEELQRLRKNVAKVAENYSWKVESKKLLQLYSALAQSF